MIQSVHNTCHSVFWNYIEHLASIVTELDCQADQWACRDSCIPWNGRCDGVKHCEGGEDEEHCCKYWKTPFKYSRGKTESKWVYTQCHIGACWRWKCSHLVFTRPKFEPILYHMKYLPDWKFTNPLVLWVGEVQEYTSPCLYNIPSLFIEQTKTFGRIPLIPYLQFSNLFWNNFSCDL